MPQAMEIENVIRHMAVLARDAAGFAGPRPSLPGWWVLLVGEALDPDDLDQRDAARERLRALASAHGVAPRELVWVWDDTGRAQLAAAHCRSLAEAEARAREFDALGLQVRVAEAMTDT